MRDRSARRQPAAPAHEPSSFSPVTGAVPPSAWQLLTIHQPVQWRKGHVAPRRRAVHQATAQTLQTSSRGRGCPAGPRQRAFCPVAGQATPGTLLPFGMPRRDNLHRARTAQGKVLSTPRIRLWHLVLDRYEQESAAWGGGYPKNSSHRHQAQSFSLPYPSKKPVFNK